MPEKRFVQAVKLSEVVEKGCHVVQLAGHTIALFSHNNQIHAVDNRCPHMGFPLHRGTVKDGILTCHWHHARFDLASGGTFDLWADDVRSFPVEIRDDEVWVDLASTDDTRNQQRQRLREGLERDLNLVIAKATINLLKGNGDAVEPFRIGLQFGVQYRRGGWGQGLTIHTCMMNLLKNLGSDDHPRALYHGLSAVATEAAGEPPRFTVSPLPGSSTDLGTLKTWFRRFIEVRDGEGAERCIVSALRAGADHQQMADLMFAAVTDHRFIDIGHPLDFTNKAFEALDHAGWDFAETVLSSLANGYAGADRMEESNAWRNPIDLIAILEDTFEKLPQATKQGTQTGPATASSSSSTLTEELIEVFLADDPHAIVEGLLEALKSGASYEELARCVAYAASLRIAQFHTSNEFGDWDTALHTFTFANAVHQGLRRAPSLELLRGVFDAAMSVYLDRFLNVPRARIPAPEKPHSNPQELIDELRELLNRQQQVNPAAELVANYLGSQDQPKPLLRLLGELLLREDRDFHTIQMIEASFRQFALQPDATVRTHILIAAARYLAAHAPTVRAQGQTYQIANRLQRGDRLFEEV